MNQLILVYAPSAVPLLPSRVTVNVAPAGTDTPTLFPFLMSIDGISTEPSFALSEWWKQHYLPGLPLTK